MTTNKVLNGVNSTEELKYEYINVFKVKFENPANLPITQLHLEKIWYEIKPEFYKSLDPSGDLPENEIEKKYLTRKTELIPALDKRWLPKQIFHNFQTYSFWECENDNIIFITNNLQYLHVLDYFLKCNYHQFWCTILFNRNAVISLRSFLLNSIPPHQVKYLKNEFLSIYRSVFNKFLLVYERLLTFKQSQNEFMPENYVLNKLIEIKLLNLPIVITLALLYKNVNVNFVNNLIQLYFSNEQKIDFKINEMDEMIKQSNTILEMIHGYVCGFDEKNTIIVPISIEKRPPIFSLSWIYSVVEYLLNTISTLNILLQFYKPSIEYALETNLPYRLPFIYVNIYGELYEMLCNREELQLNEEMTEKIFDLLNIGRSEFVDVFHTFISYCLNKALENMENSKEQENIVEVYLNLLTTALEYDYFICDYDVKYNIAIQNEMFESCCTLDSTRTQFITECVKKLPRHKRLEELSQYRSIIEDVFKKFKPILHIVEEPPEEPIPGPSNTIPTHETDIEAKIKDIIDMFPHLGDGFVLKCLEMYDYKSSDVINAILEENLPPHLYEIPFNEIRIPPEPEPEQPVLAYHGKKPEYDDALKLLNDKKDIKQIKTFVLEGVQYNNDYLYDDEYDDQFDDDVPIKVADNPITAETYNPNHDRDTSEESEDEEIEEDVKKPQNNNKMNFCEDPAVLRARREARFRRNQPQTTTTSKPKDVVGKPKGQGQDKNVLNNRQKKNVNKSSRANHNRKTGAQFKRNRGMIPS